MFHIKKSGSVSDYITGFTTLVDQLSAYESARDPLYFTLCFVDDIHAPVLLQRPSDSDTACVLAQLQEEVLDSSKKKEFWRSDYFTPAKQVVKGVFPLPVLPWIDKGGTFAVPVECQGPDHSRQRPFDERMSALRAYRRARGLCEKCAERWSRDHLCAEKVQLHALQEI